MLEEGSRSHAPDGVYSMSCDSDSIKVATSLVSDGSGLKSIGNVFCTDAPVPSDRCASADTNLCGFPLGHISQADSDLEFFGNDREDKESSDLLYYDWPDMGNFEDVDRMFRSCDSTFGLGTASNDDELSWFSSSSCAIDGSEDALKPGSKSSCSESSALKSTSEHHEADMKYICSSVTPLVNDSGEKSVLNTSKTSFQTLDANESATFSPSSYANCLDANAENRGEFTSKGQINLQRKQSKHQNQSSEGKRKDRYVEHLSGGSFHCRGTMKQFASVKLPSPVTSCQQVFHSQGIQQQKQNIGPDCLTYLHTYIPYVHSEYNHPSDQIPVTPTLSSTKSKNKARLSLSLKASSYASDYAQNMERSPDPSAKEPAMTSDEKIENIHQRQEVQGTSTVDPQHVDLVVHAAFADQIPVRKQLHQIQNKVSGHGGVEGMSKGLPAEVDSSNVQESSCVSSVLDEISLEASFRQLQFVMEQLDVRTKLCLRDSLYRLARSAEQRHHFGNSDGSSKYSRDKSEVLTTEESNKFEFMHTETDTNPIDRSIAHLLFLRPSDPSIRPANDALSLEALTIIHGSITSQPVMTEKLVSQEEIAGGTNAKLLITDQ
ncbi:hypothetical protein HHK36_009467 [Tetracentron sinense]|uniref:Protein LNK1-like n=1 Tax=Tetracentron sinense TaxID=13715 RepID=A0A834ZFA2_TETSI|nr:hypothetical protein HHK36_009467 [Tetracentron sinense]